MYMEPILGTNRKAHRAISNNLVNPNQNICAQAVAMELGVADEIRHLHTIHDIKRAAGKRFSVRSVMTAVKGKGKSVGAIRNNVNDIAAEYFICWVDGHVILLDTDGNTLVDTAPRKRDRRKLKGIYGVYPK